MGTYIYQHSYKKSLCHGSQNMANTQSENVQKFNEVIKRIKKTIETLRVEFSAGKKILAFVKITKRDLLGRCVITITLSYHDDATQTHTQKMHRWIQT